MSMVAGVSPSHTSVPAAAGVAAGGGRRHLVACGPGADAEPLRARLRAAGVEPAAVELLHAGEPATAEATLREHAGEPAAAEAALREWLAVAHVGVRLHLVGSDAFVRRMAAVAVASGLQADEIGVSADEARPAFRVACVHCRAITEPAERTVVRCAGCARTLFVYHHYSRRKAAYMGFQADAEVAGELPEGRSGVPCP